MTKIWITLTLLCTGLWVQVTESHGASLDGGQQIPRGPATQSVNPPNFPPQPQFTHWSHVTPFALERANQFRPGPPPALNSDTYSDGFNEVKALGDCQQYRQHCRPGADWPLLEWGDSELLERDHPDRGPGA